MENFNGSNIDTDGDKIISEKELEALKGID
jgi:hypothetical protein